MGARLPLTPHSRNLRGCVSRRRKFPGGLRIGAGFSRLYSAGVQTFASKQWNPLASIITLFNIHYTELEFIYYSFDFFLTSKG